MLRPALPRGREWRYELKLDGFRGLLHIDGDRAWFASKTMKRMARFRDLAASLHRHVEVEDVILDVKIVVIGENARPEFYKLLMARGEPQYAAFDLLWLNGRDFRPDSYSKRRLRFTDL